MTTAEAFVSARVAQHLGSRR